MLCASGEKNLWRFFLVPFGTNTQRETGCSWRSPHPVSQSKEEVAAKKLFLVCDDIHWHINSERLLTLFLLSTIQLEGEKHRGKKEEKVEERFIWVQNFCRRTRFEFHPGRREKTSATITHVHPIETSALLACNLHKEHTNVTISSRAGTDTTPKGEKNELTQKVSLKIII